MDNQQTNLLCQTDIQTVDIQNLVDISDVKIDTTMKKRRTEYKILSGILKILIVSDAKILL